MLRLATVLCLVSSTAYSQQAPLTMEARMFQVCQEQRNAVMTWHAGSEAQRGALQEQLQQVQKELNELKAKIKGNSK